MTWRNCWARWSMAQASLPGKRCRSPAGASRAGRRRATPACGDGVGCHAVDEVVQDGLDLVEGDVPRCAGHRRERGGYGVLRAS